MRCPSRIATITSLAALGMAAPAAAETFTVTSGDLRAQIESEPWSLEFIDEDGREVVAEAGGMRLGFATPTGWAGASGPATVTAEGAGIVAEVDAVVVTPIAPVTAGRLRIRVTPAADGVIAVALEPIAADGARSLGVGFRATDDERFYGMGERPAQVDQRGQESVETYVADGPYYRDPAERTALSAFIPAAGYRQRDDATYFPIPWVLSSEGYGVLVDNTEPAYHGFGDAASWSLEVTNALEGQQQTAPASLRFRVFGGSTPARVLRRFTREVGRQPAPAAPWVWGSWFQPGGTLEEQIAQLDKLRAADAPVSVMQTYLHYLPCGDHVGGQENERKRVDAFHDRGTAVTTYFNPMICESYKPPFDEAAAAGALAKRADGSTYTYRYASSPDPEDQFDVGQFDFSHEPGRSFYARLLAEAVADGHDGWMEDFGEYTPLDSHYANGMTGVQMHNLYPTQYHCAAHDFVKAQQRPIVRFQRSGFTGVASCAQVVWSGDPSVAWDFDGLESQIKAGLSIGLSGISTWGSDIGGFFALNDRALTPELLKRWVQFGAVSPVMRMQRNGVAFPSKERPQAEDDDQIGNWRRYAKLHTRLYPYLEAADRFYRRTGMPIMRHLALAYPADERSGGREDEYLFGPDLLAAPVFSPGATTREVYLPPGEWVPFWGGLRYRERQGDLRLHRARLMAGGAERTVDAPLDELPLFVRAGAVLPLLPADVDTLAPYGPGENAVPFTKRRGRLDLLAFPRGRWKGTFFKGERIESREGNRRLTLRIRGKRRRIYTAQISMATLNRPFRPCGVRYDKKTRVARVTLKGRRVTATVKPC